MYCGTELRQGRLDDGTRVAGNGDLCCGDIPGPTLRLWNPWQRQFTDEYGPNASGSRIRQKTLKYTNFNLLVLSIELTYYIAVAFVKVSIVFFYLRLVQATTTMRRVCYGTIGLLVTFLAICEIITLVQCIPITKQWDLTGVAPGHCVNTTAFFYSTSAFNILTDIWIIVLPIRILSRIQLPKREKLILLIVFGMGVLACVASMVRLYSIRAFTLSTDPFFDSGPVNIWSMVEINIAIICASVPALKPLFIKPAYLRSRSSGSDLTAYHSSKILLSAVVTVEDRGEQNMR